MLPTLIVWFRSLFRPNMTSVSVKLYENGKERDITAYNENRLRIVSTCIDHLWDVPQDSPYWFDTELVTQHGCLRKRKDMLMVTCYKSDKFNPKRKVPTDIPIRYRKKMFDKKHPIHPKVISNINWPDRMEVIFVTAEK